MGFFSYHKVGIDVSLTLFAAIALSVAAASAAEWKDTADAKLVKFVPAGFAVVQEARGDLNGDGTEDRVLLVKDTDKEKVFPIRDDPETYGYYDGNHYGVIALFGGGGGYRAASENLRFLGPAFNDCELCPQGIFSCEIKKGVVHIVFSKQGRNWDESLKYLFRYRDSDFELIGYDKDDIQNGKNIDKTSINFPAGKRVRKSGGKEVWDKFTLRGGPVFMRKLKDDLWKTGFDAYIAEAEDGAAATAAPAAAAPTSPAPKTAVGTFADARDGKKYKTVTIGGKKWFAENLNVKTGTSWCYNDQTIFCGGGYGRLYNWSTAAKMACPAGTHLPTRDEWNALIKASGGADNAGNALKLKSGWNKRDNGGDGGGADGLGFAAFPSGRRLLEGGFAGAGDQSGWWTADEADGGDAYYIYMRSSGDFALHGQDRKGVGYSARCVVDDN